MAMSVDGGALPKVTPSSANLPLQPFTPPGTINVAPENLRQFIRGFPPPKGLAAFAEASLDAADRVGGALAKQLANGDAQRVLQAIVVNTARSAPSIVGGIAELVSLSGQVASVAGPFASLIPYVGAGVAAGLEIYAPLATVGGETVKTLSAVAQAAQLAAGVAQQAAGVVAGDPASYIATGGRGPQP